MRPKSTSRRVHTASAIGLSRSGIALVLSIAVARTAGASVRGELAYMQVLCYTGFLVGDLGVTSSIRQLTTRAKVLELQTYTFIGFVLVPLTSLGVAIIFSILSPSNFSTPFAMALGLNTTLAIGATRFSIAALNAVGEFARAQAVELLEGIGQVTAVVTAFLLVGRSSSVVLAAFSAGTLLGPIAGVLLARQQTGPPKFEKDAMVALVSGGVKTIPTNAGTGALTRIDQLIVGSMLGPDLLGRYAVAASFAEVARPRIQAASQFVFRSAAVGTVALGRELPALLRQSLRVQLVVSMTVPVCSLFLMPAIFGTQFQGLGLVVFFLAIGELGFVGFLFGMRSLLGSGRSLQASFNTFLAVLVVCLADFLLIPVAGLKGAAIGNFLAYTAAAILCLTNVRRATRQYSGSGHARKVPIGGGDET